MIPTETIDTLAELWASISELCGDLSEAEWKQPTDLAGWSVQDNLAHLIAVERMLEGLAGTGHRAAPADHVRNSIGEMNENEVDSRRSLAGAEVLAEWEAIVAQRLATLRSADDAYFARETMTPTGPGTVADFLHLRVLDCWAHEQDIRRAVSRPGDQDSRAAAHTIDRLIRTVPIVVAKRAGTPDGDTVVIVLTGPVERTIVCTVAGGRAALVDTVPTAPPPVATVRMDSDTFTVLALGRRTADALAGSWHLEGDTTLGQRIVDQLSMMI